VVVTGSDADARWVPLAAAATLNATGRDAFADRNGPDPDAAVAVIVTEITR
jgi:hypothetical protein